MDILTNAILSIKPQYAQAILAGNKRVEFRKKVFKRPVDKVYIYSSSPIKRLIGYFTFTEIDEATPTDLWKKYEKIGAINKADFFAYFKDCDTGFAINIEKVERFEKGINPINVIDKFCAPQSYRYVDENIISQNSNALVL